MKAAILTEFNKPILVEDVPEIPVGDRDVKVRVDASGVCHSDLTVATGGTTVNMPIILGHEGAGTVLEVGREVIGVRPGDRVIASYVPACGACWFCLRGQSNLCDMTTEVRTPARAKRNGQPMWTHTGLGTMSQVMTVDQAMVVRVETDLPAEQLALIGCGVTTGVGAAINTAQIEPGATVAVIGCGGVGSSIIQGARIAGASRIFAIDPVEMKRTTAKELGATDGIDPMASDPIEQIREATHGRGVDYAFEAIGYGKTLMQAIEMTRRGGSTILVGMARLDDSITLSPAKMFREGKKLLSCYYGSAAVRRDFPRLINLVESGRLDVGSIVSRRIQLEGINDAFRAMEAGEVMRSVIIPN